MGIYSKKKRDTSYHRIWIEHNGPIPKDEQGRSMEIHHIDGDKTNNDISNLQLVTIQEHYEIHLNQKDWGACHMIAVRMNKSPEEISHFARLGQLRLIEQGVHHLCGPDFNLKRVANGTHHWLDGTKSSETQRKLVESGNHRFVKSDWQRQNQLKLVENGKHNFAGGEIQRRSNKKLLEEGKRIRR